jgi:hypothetical protein
VLLELTVAEQRFNAVMEVLRDGLTVIEVADRSHRPRRCPHQMPATVEAPCASYAGAILSGVSAAWLTSWSGSVSIHRPG